MRYVLVLLVACGHAAPPPVEHHAAPTPPPPPPAPTSDLRARVAVAGGGSWTDIQVDGTDDAARAFCDRLVERELHGPRGVVELTVARGCAAEVLPVAADASAYRLVESDDVSTDDFSVDDLLAGHREELAHATAHLVRVVPAADRAACDALTTRLDAEDQKDWIAQQQATHEFLESQITSAKDRERRACEKIGKLEPCKGSRTERAPCEVLRDEVTRVCTEATEIRRELEAKHVETHEAPASRRTCQPR